MPESPTTEDSSPLDWNELLPVVLDSPVVIALLVIILLLVFRKSLIGILASRNVEIRWGENHIKLNELSNSLDQEIDPLKAEIESLRDRLDSIEDAREIENHPFLSDPDEIKDDNIRQAILAALASRKYRWRSIPGLAKAAKVDERKVMDILANDDSIVVGYDKSGETLAKLKSR